MKARLLAFTLLLLVAALHAAPRPPNIVIIFTDDQGYADVGAFGAKGFKTPNLDRLAREGSKFTNFHVAQPVCSASRAALLTGCYPNRLGIHGALGPNARHGLNTNEVTLAEFAHGHPVWVRQSPGARFAGVEAVQRAYSRIGEDRYRLISNNCEHFCTWCLYGESRSEQIDVWRFRASDVVAAGFKVVRLLTVATSLSVSVLRAVSRFGFEGQTFANSTQSTS